MRGDFNVVWKPKPDLSVSVGVQNAFYKRHAEASTGMASLADIKRALYAEVSYQF